ncbi:MAG: hypothetical protein E7Z99_05965 [Coriobacteriaceae bacterium]|nr:hypothetical protein [Coriobacteriaceae bacterium]
MSKEEKAGNVWPMFPKWDPAQAFWNGDKEKSKEQFKKFEGDMKEFWEKSIDIQKSSIDRSKDQYDQFFEYVQDMMDDFAGAFPEEMPWLPAWAMPPKSFRKEMKEWEKMANEHFKEQMGSMVDFFIQGQEKACAKVPAAEEGAGETKPAAGAKAK